MEFRCSELQGAIYQPKELLELDNCWVIPACKAGAVLGMEDHKLIFVYRKDQYDWPFIEYPFVCCYQFLFCRYSYIYWFYSLRHLNRSKPFIVDGTNISDIEKQIRNKYGQLDTVYGKYVLKDFTNIESQYSTWLPNPVNFKEFYVKFVELYTKNNEDNEFKEIVTLFCETANGARPLYNNVLQQIAQLQTIFETLTGTPRTTKCDNCGKDYYVEKWNDFLEKCLKELGITDSNHIALIKKLKTTLNNVARVKYIHHASYHNPSELRKLVNINTDGQSEYKTDIDQVLKKNSDSWNSLDWFNIYGLYSIIVRNLIYSKYSF